MKGNIEICNKIRKMFRIVIMLVVLLSFLLTGCGKTGKVVFTTGFSKDEVFRIDSVSCFKQEMMLYLTTTQNQYESVYGTEVWSIEKDDMTLEDNVKDTVLARIAQVKTLCLLAQKKEVTLEEEEENKAIEASKEFFESLNEHEVEMLEISQDTIEEMYKEYALADKVYHYIIQDINPEISDDEARIVTVQTILLHTWTTDGIGNRIDYSENVKNSILDKIYEIREMAVTEGQNFLDLASRYSQDVNISFSFGKGELDGVFEETVFALATDEISDVIETEEGYYIVKCISTFDRQETDEHKQEIVEERKREVFGEEYDAFTESLVRQLNTKLWGEISLIHDEQVTTDSFFEIYEKYFD